MKKTRRRVCMCSETRGCASGPGEKAERTHTSYTVRVLHSLVPFSSASFLFSFFWHLSIWPRNDEKKPRSDEKNSIFLNFPLHRGQLEMSETNSTQQMDVQKGRGKLKEKTEGKGEKTRSMIGHSLPLLLSLHQNQTSSHFQDDEQAYLRSRRCRLCDALHRHRCCRHRRLGCSQALVYGARGTVE